MKSTRHIRSQKNVRATRPHLFRHAPKVAALATMIAAATVSTSLAQTNGTWNPTPLNLANVSGSWGVGTNWTGGTIAGGIGAIADFSTLNITGNATVTLDGPRTVGTLRFQDATTASNDWILNTGTGGPLTLDAVGAGPASIVVLNRTATIGAVVAGSDVIAATGAGTLALTGANTFTGQLTIGSGLTVSAGNALALGATGAGAETIVQAGGTLNVNATNLGTGEEVRISGRGVGDAGALINNGAGQLNALSTVVLTNHATIGGSGRFDIRNGTPLLDLAGFRLTKIGGNQFSVVNGSITSGNIDIAAGTFSMETGIVVSGGGLIAANPGGTLGFWSNAGVFTRSIALNGGTIRELGSNNAATTVSSNISLTANSTINVAPGGGLTNLNLFGNITETGGIQNLTKGEAGKLTLHGSQNFTGALNINAGTVALGVNSTLATRQISIADGAVFDASARGGYNLGGGGTLLVGRNGAASDVIGNFTAGAGSTIGVGANFTARTATFANSLTIHNTTLNVDLGTFGNDNVSVGADLSATGINSLNIRPTTDQGFVSGSYVLFNYAGSLNSTPANFAVGNAGNFRQTFAFDTTTVAGQVLLNVNGAAASLTWTGGGAANAWDINTTSNWDNAGPDKYYDTDAVTFTDAGSNLPAVNIKSAVTPGVLTVNNSSKDYVFGGKGTITGPAGLNKMGSSKLTLTNDNHDFSGPVSVTGGGTLSGNFLSNNGVAGSFGTGAITIDGGTLEYTGGTITSNRTISVGVANGAIRVAEPLSTLTLSTAVGGFGALIKSGPGILTLGAVGVFTGDIAINEGVLRPTTNAVLGSKTILVAAGATFDPNGQTANAAPARPTLNIAGNGVPGAAAIWNSGGAVTNNPLYTTVNLTGDAVIGTPVRYDLNGGTGGFNFNADLYTVQFVGTGEKWWSPNAGAIINDVFVRHGRFGVQSSNNLASHGSITSSAIYVLPVGELATFADGTTNTKPIVLSGGTLASTGAAAGATVGQFWRGGVSLSANSFFNNRGTAATNQITIDNIDPSVAPLVLNGATLEKLGGTNESGLLVLANPAASATGTGAGTLRIYNGNVTLQSGFIMDGAGQVRLQNFGQLNLNNNGVAPVLTKTVRLDGGTLNNAAGSNSAAAIVVGAHGRIFNSAAGTTLSLGDITVPANRGIQFGTNGSVVLTTINGAAPVVGLGNRLGVDFTAGTTPAATGFATWNGSIVGVLPTTVTNPTAPTATDDSIFSGATTLSNADLTTRTLVSGANVVIANTRLFTIGSGGMVLRGAAHSINTAANNNGRLTTGAADGRLVINTPDLIDAGFAGDIRAQMVDTPLVSGFRPMIVYKNGPGQSNQWGTDAGGTMLNNLYSCGTVINSGRVVPSGTLGLGTGSVTINDGGQLATFNLTGAAGQATFLHNNVIATGRGAGENAGYLGAIRVGTNSNMSGRITVSDVTRIHNQNGQGALSGIIQGTGTLQHTGTNITWLTNPASTFGGVNEFGFRDQTGAIQILVAKLANGGLPSSLGNSPSAASNLVFNINPILRYVGNGDSTNRLFTLAGGYNINGTPGAVIDGSGYGAINFTSTGNVEFGPGSYRQLTLRASTLSTGATTVGGNLPLNIFSPNLGDPADHGFGQLVKDGPGRWAITANHTYSGTTTVNDGILILGNGGTTGMFGNGAGGLGPNQVTIAGNASILLNRTDSYTIPNTIVSGANGNNEVVQLGGGTVSLAGPNDNGSTRVRVENGVLELAKKSSTGIHTAALLATIGSGGTLRLAGTGDDQIFDGSTNGTWTTVQMNGGTFDLNGRDEAVYRVEGTGAITNTAAGTTGTLTFGGSLAGVGNGASRLGGGLAAAITNGAGTTAITKAGTGTIALTGSANSYSGITTINGGTLSIGNGGTTGTLGSGPVNIATVGALAVNRSNAYTVTNAITGGGGLTQQGTGTTTVSAPLGYTGSTTVNAGVLNVDLTGSNNVLSAAGRLVLNGGTAKFTGGPGGTSAQTVAEFQVAGGNVIVDGTAGLTTLNLPATLLRPAGGTVNFATLGATAINSTVANSNNVLGTVQAAYATVNGTDWATGSAGAIVPFAAYTADTYASGTHTDVVASGAIPTGTTSTLRLNTPAIAALTLGGPLVLDQGGILVTPAMNAGTSIAGGTLTGAASAGSEIVVHQHTTSGIASATQISSSIIDNGANLTGLTKAGNGILALTGANTYGGETHVNQGILSVGAFGTAGSLGTGPVYNDAVLAFARTDAVTVNNAIGGSGQVVQSGGGTVRLNAPNTFTGGLVVSNGTVSSDRGYSVSSNPTNSIFGLGGGTTEALSNADPANGAGLGAITLGDANTGANNVAFLSEFGADFANPIIVSASGTGTATIGSNSGAISGVNPAMFSGPVTLNRATTFLANNADRTTWLGAIGGNPGTVTISGATAGTNTGGLNRTTWENTNTFTGNVVIAANSTLQVGTGAFAAPLDQIPDTAGVTLNATSFLTLNGDSETINTLNSTATNSQVQSAAGGGQALRVLNGGTFNGIFNGGNNTGMTIEVAGGTMTFGGTVDNSTGRILVTGGTAVFGKVSTPTVHANAVDLTINTGGTALIGGTFTGTLPTYGTGVVLPANFRDQIFDGGTGASSSVVINGGTLDLGGFSEGFGRLDGYGGVVTNSAAATTSTLYVGTASISNLFTAGFFGNVQNGAGTVALAKVGNGISIFASDLLHTGGTSIFSGALQIGNGGTTGTIGGNVALVNAATSSLIFNRGGTALIPANISGGGPVIVNGTGVVKFSGANTYSGPTTINAGGTLQIGDAGTTGTIGTGNVTLHGTLAFKRSDAITVSNAIVGPGTVNQEGTGTTLLNGPLDFPVANVNDGCLTLDSVLANATINDNNGILVVRANANNSTVNVADEAYFTVSQTLAALNITSGGVATLGGSPHPAPAFEPQGGIAAFDDAAVQQGGVAAVPEPGAFSLLLLGALGMLGCRRRSA